MEITLYDFITLFIVVPILFFKWTYIPEWLFGKARRIKTTTLVCVLAVLLVCIAAFVVAVGSQGFAIRFMALAVAVIACAAHYLYNAKREE